jgi:hypothetical protein
MSGHSGHACPPCCAPDSHIFADSMPVANSLLFNALTPADTLSALSRTRVRSTLADKNPPRFRGGLSGVRRSVRSQKTRASIFLVSCSLLAVIESTGMSADGVPIRPDPALTPGATIAVTLEQVCTPGYSKTARHVSLSEKRAVFAEYGIQPSGAFEIDHLISLELGGSNAIENLWPQSYLTQPWNAHVKDALENRLHALVCRRQLSLADAQATISGDWVAAYRQYVKKQAPGRRTNGPAGQ